MRETRRAGQVFLPLKVLLISSIFNSMQCMQKYFWVLGLARITKKIYIYIFPAYTVSLRRLLVVAGTQKLHALVTYDMKLLLQSR